ncbi:MAG: kelch repeat-containing protein [Bacteroidota bacterium]
MRSRRLYLQASALLVAAAVVLSCLPAAQAQHPAGADGAWRTVASDAPPVARHEHAYVRVGERFYLVGGRGERPVQSFDPVSGAWSTHAMPPIELHHFQAVAHEGKIYVIGALTGGWPTEDPVAHVYIYDPVADAWTQGPAVPEDRRRGAAGAVVHDGEIFVVAGIRNGHTDGHVRWLDAYDPATGGWRRLADAPRTRDHFHAAVLDGKLYAAGGRRSSHATGQGFELTIPEVDVYDFATDTWTPLPPSGDLPTERAGTTVAVLDGRLLVLGGESGSQVPAHAEVEAFDPETGTWTALAPMRVGRHGMQAVVYEQKVYVASGSKTRGADEVDSQEVYSQTP